MQQLWKSSSSPRLLLTALAMAGAGLLGAGICWLLLDQGTHGVHASPAEVPDNGAIKAEGDVSHDLVRDPAGKPVQPPLLRLSREAAATLNIVPGKTVVQAREAVEPQALPPLEGNLAFENDSLYPVRTRFAGEVVEIGKTAGDVPQLNGHPLEDPSGDRSPGSFTEPRRYLGPGDRVKEGELLAVLWSRDLGAGKAALIDSTIDLRRDQKRFKDLEKVWENSGAVSANTYYEAQRLVQKDLSAVNAAERTLRMWKLTDQDIDALKQEAASIENSRRDPKRETEWARVEVRAPHDGVIVEKNTNLGDWVDPSKDTPMFRVADLRTLAVWAHPLEEYLPTLQAAMLKGGSRRLHWKIRLQAEPATTLEGPVLRIAPSLDPTQHTLLVMGRVDNPDGKLLVGQFITATILVAPEKDLVEVPTAALNEENGQSLVFVQPDRNKLEFALRRVAVADRFKHVVFLRSKLTEQDERESEAAVRRGLRRIQPLLPGERVVTQGVPMLTVAVRDLLAKEVNPRAAE